MSNVAGSDPSRVFTFRKSPSVSSKVWRTSTQAPGTSVPSHAVTGILGMKAAVDYIESVGIEEIRDYEWGLKKYAVCELEKTGMADIYNPHSEAGIVAFNVKGVFAQDAATFLNSRGIACRSGNHCAKILIDYLGQVATVRASFYFYTTREDIDRLVDAVRHGKEFLDAYF